MTYLVCGSFVPNCGPGNLEVGSCRHIWIRPPVKNVVSLAKTSPSTDSECLLDSERLLDTLHTLLGLGQRLKYKTVSLTSYKTVNVFQL